MKVLEKKISKKLEFSILLGIVLVTSLVYFNHFDNPFFFDDSHTISSNSSIKTLDNWTEFFTNAETFSSLPSNRAYRPWVTLMNAIDYNIANGNPIAFHVHIFVWFCVLIVLVYFLSKKLYMLSDPNNKWIIICSLIACSWFSLHTANAETINYICARSDSFSTLAIVASLLLYIYPKSRKYHLYLITMVIGIWTKQTGVMFIPILFTYIILFEENSILDNFKNNFKKAGLNILKKIAPSATLGLSLFIFNQFYLTPSSTDSTNNQVTRFEYITTQFYVIKHYLSNFILPVNLSADPDLTIIKPWYNLKIIFGLIIISLLVFILVKTALKKELRPIAFGIAWFFIALIPTTLNPLYQIANDHRMFFPFIGLFIAIPWAISYLIKKYNLHKSVKNFKYKLILIITLLFFGHAYGTFQRNKIWDNSISLWRDVSIKSPKNGRGLMNYGLALMAKGNYDNAEIYFKKALKLNPNWGTLHTNLAILNGAKGNSKKAINYFNSAAKLDPYSPASYYYHARYLANKKEYDKALVLLNKALETSPNHFQSIELSKRIEPFVISEKKQLEKLIKESQETPSIANYLRLNLKYFELKRYREAVEICFKILEIDSNNSTAYNNLCVAYNHLQKWELGAEACKKAIAIDPNFQLAKNNLNWANNNLPNKQ